MERFNRDLLLLAKIGNEQFAADGEVNVAAVISEVADGLAAMAYKVDIVASGKEVEVTANRTLLESLVTNLMVNAVRNSGEVEVSLSGGRFAVSNPSKNGEPLDREKLFRRFAKTLGPGGNGLGLAIAKSICDFHHWNIEYLFANGRHCFVVEMK